VKAVILAGGLGSRISEETVTKPKPMIEIGSKPILWHIMKIYSHHGINDFVICCGYRGYVIKEYFANYFLHMSDVTFDMGTNKMHVHQGQAEPWRVTLVDTGDHTMTGGRIRRIRSYVEDEDFCLTYGDGVGNVDISALIECHRRGGRECTLTAVQPPGRFGSLVIDGENRITSFREKPEGDGSWINGGFFVCSPSVIDRIEADETIWEREPLESLALDREIGAFPHAGFWQPMDTLRDKLHLEKLWMTGQAPWKIW
jgi:glucose-1-phosphate cytidylyltransferase